MKHFDWTPGIGDASAAGWLTVLLYLVAALVCLGVFRRLSGQGHVSKRESQAWRWIFVLFVALGINKQLDLQTALTEAGRVIAHMQGWYEERRIVQATFVISVAVVCCASAIVLANRFWPMPGSTQVAMVGTILVLGFIVIRAASFHHFDRFIGDRFLQMRWNWILEIGGISLVLLAGLVRLKSIKTQHRTCGPIGQKRD